MALTWIGTDPGEGCVLFILCLQCPPRLSSLETPAALACPEPDLLSLLRGDVSALSAWAPELVQGSRTGAIS